MRPVVRDGFEYDGWAVLRGMAVEEQIRDVTEADSLIWSADRQAAGWDLAEGVFVDVTDQNVEDLCGVVACCQAVVVSVAFVNHFQGLVPGIASLVEI